MSPNNKPITKLIVSRGEMGSLTSLAGDKIDTLSTLIILSSLRSHYTLLHLLRKAVEGLI